MSLHIVPVIQCFNHYFFSYYWLYPEGDGKMLRGIYFKVLILILLIGYIMPTSFATTIIDTGEGGNAGGSMIEGNKFSAAQFELSHATTVTSAEAWMSTFDTPKDITMRIYGDSSHNLPDGSIVHWSGLHDQQLEYNRLVRHQSVLPVPRPGQVLVIVRE